MSDILDLLGDFNILGISSVKMQTPKGYDQSEIALAETRINEYRTECGESPVEFIDGSVVVELVMGKGSHISYNIKEHTIFVKHKENASMSILINADLRNRCIDMIKEEHHIRRPLSMFVWPGSIFINLLMLLKINMNEGTCVSPKKILESLGKPKKSNIMFDVGK